jgi:hypothetical protein
MTVEFPHTGSISYLTHLPAQSPSRRRTFIKVVAVDHNIPLASRRQAFVGLLAFLGFPFAPAFLTALRR